ncbi:hypothetical protein [Vibrio sonorensis]|uniref:HoxN/HupN/NixA family nickel/cobalt transporter n=1 Tax=Vibrio sonorensis TaxID=1004316 RepID=UPI0008DAE01A|nr:hypothetical protein [Vibrio sonorensis]
MNRAGVKLLIGGGLFVLFSFLGYQLYSNFPVYWIQLNSLQREAADNLSAQLINVQNNWHQHLFYFLGFAYLYGTLHALAPGHGKTAIVTTSLLYQLSPKQILVLVSTISYLQALTACLLFLLVTAITPSLPQNMSIMTQWLTKACALFILLLAIKHALNLFNNRSKKNVSKADRYSLYSTLLIGLRPCTSTLLTMFLATMFASAPLGYLAAFTMATGTITTISLFVFNANGIKRHWLKHFKQERLSKIGQVVIVFSMAVSGAFLFAISRFVGLPNFIR